MNEANCHVHTDDTPEVELQADVEIADSAHALYRLDATPGAKAPGAFS